ncbi:ABC transporter substrate-binding protein [Oricola sp.]|uniref:ABC transporter substrate-binding protein n=1 Tax=Oricola sp. TaxID=1979950 RepID=UPI003BABBCDD
MKDLGIKGLSALGDTTRRGFLRGSAATGVVASGLAGGLMTTPARAQPKRGGTIRVAKGHGQTNDTLDPGTWTNGFNVAMSYGMHGHLTAVGADNSLKPQLAESWEATPDAKSWRFKIRKGVTFHSGKSLELSDVIASIDHHRGEDSTSAAKPLVAGIVSMSTDGDDTVVFDLESGNADFPFVFTDYHLPILPAKDGNIDWKAGDGCGPYKLVEFNPGVIARFERFADDWDQNRGWFEAIEMLSILDLNARTTALVSGDVHSIDKLDLKTVGLLGRRAGISINSIAGPQYYTFAMHTNVAPYDDVNVRMALKYAIDRQEMIDKVLFGHGTVGNDHPIGKSYRYFNAEMPQTPYDPDKAKFHLKEAGLDGVKVKLSAADAAFPGAVDAAVLYQNSAKACGIDLEVNRVPSDGYWADVWLKHPFCAVYWGGRPTEDQIFSTAYAEGAAWNETMWSNKRFNELLVMARAELDEDKRRAQYYEMQDLVAKDAGSVMPMFANFVFANSEKIGSGDMASNYDCDGERWMERWWFA